MLTLRFSRSNCFTSWGIAAATNWYFSHVDIVMPDGRLLGANVTPGHDLSGAIVKAGVAIRDPDYDKPVRELFVTYPSLPDITPDALKYVGEKFDWSYVFGILRTGIPRNWGNTDGFACIELAEWCLRERGASLLHMEYDPWRITPAMGMLSPYGSWSKRDVIYYPHRGGFWCSAKPIAW